MLRIFVGILVISYFSDRVTSQLPSSFVDIPRAFNLNLNRYQKAVRNENANMTKEEVGKILQVVDNSSSELNNLDTSRNIKCNDMLKSLLADRYSDIDPDSPTKMFCHGIGVINDFFEKSWDYKVGELFNNQTFQNFGYEALWGDINIPDTLENINELFSLGIISPEILLRELQRTKGNHENDCDTYVSIQQRMYYMYYQLIMTELKGLVLIQRIYLTKRLFNEISDNYIAELQYENNEFEKRLNGYYEEFDRYMDGFPQQIHRCDVKRPERGDNIIELKKFSRITILDSELKTHYTCKKCPSTSALAEISAHTNTTIYNCMNLGSTVQFCPAEPGSYRDYLWWRDEHGTIYGTNTTCDLKILRPKLKLNNFLDRIISPMSCKVCACSADQNKIQKDDNTTIWRISVTEQISDVQNNMVVTGVRFVTYDSALHLQIYQANFSHSGQVYNHGRWKELDIGFGNEGLTPTKVKMLYEPLHYNRKSLWLDDIKVPGDTVITGVRLQAAGDSAFKLQILPMPFKFGTGQLISFGGNWIDAMTNPMRPDDYKQTRMEINLDNSDDPTRGTEFKYDPKSNRLVKFTHSDIHKDAGQTTIPLLDGQSVETQPPFPLGGIGFSYRGKEGFGGYIAPRIYTMNVAKYMRSLRSATSTQHITTEDPTASGEEDLSSD